MIAQRKAALVQAFADFLDALSAETPGTKALRTASTPSPIGAKAAPVAAVRARTPAPQPGVKPLPTPLTPAPKPTELDPAVRAANLPDAVKVAKRVIAAVGPEGAMLYTGVWGELSLQHIAFDETLIAEAIAQAKAER